MGLYGSKSGMGLKSGETNANENETKIKRVFLYRLGVSLLICKECLLFTLIFPRNRQVRLLPYHWSLEIAPSHYRQRTSSWHLYRYMLHENFFSTPMRLNVSLPMPRLRFQECARKGFIMNDFWQNLG